MDNQKMMKNVDVIILSWDREEETLAAIKSAEAQVDVEFKIYVLDQGSNDNCKKVLKDYCDRRENIFWAENEFNTGVPGGRNQASFLGHSDVIVSLDNDAEFEHERVLKDTLDVFNSNDKLAVACFRVSLFGKKDIDKSSWSYGMSHEEWGFKQFYTTRFVGAGHAIRRDLFTSVKGYDADLFFLHEEVELARRFINLGYTICYFPHLAVGHKVSSERRISWSGERWRYHVRNKTYLTLKYRNTFMAALFHIVLLLRDSIKMKQLVGSTKAAFDGFKMYLRNKHRFVSSECRFNTESELYYRKYTPGAGGSLITRVKQRLRGK